LWGEGGTSLKGAPARFVHFLPVKEGGKGGVRGGKRTGESQRPRVGGGELPHLQKRSHENGSIFREKRKKTVDRGEKDKGI